MKKLLTLILLGVLCSIGDAWADITPTQIYANGYENGEGTWSGSLTVSSVSTIYRTGAKAIKVDYTGSTSEKNSTQSTGSSVSKDASTYCHVIGWVKPESGTATTTKLGFTSGKKPSSSTLSSSDWVRLTYNSNDFAPATIIIYKGGAKTGAYYDDIIAYASNSNTTDLTKPSAATLSGSPTSSSFSWSNGSDSGTGATGIQKTYIWKRTKGTSDDLTLNDQGIYSLTSTEGPSTDQSGNWSLVAVLETSVTTYSEADESSRYAIVHRDLAYNYSSPLYVSTAAATAHTVSFNAGSHGTYTGGNIAEASAGAGITLPALTTLATGYTFNGWYTASTGGTKAGDASANYKPSSDITLYAQYSAKTYSITLHDNNGDVASGSAIATYDSKTLTINSTPTKAGNSVVGYYKEAGLTNLIADAEGNLERNTDYTDASGNWANDGAVTLYAKWEAAKYTVTIAKNNNDYGSVTSASVEDVDYNTAISATDNVLSVGATDITATAADATAEYTYAFNNWTSIPDGGKVTGNITVTANFTRTPINYTLTWEGNGDGATLSGEYTSGTTAFGTTITKPTATRTGYTFLGWAESASGAVVEIPATMPASDKTYYAKWEAIAQVISTTNHYKYYYKDAAHFDGVTYKNPLGSTAESGDNKTLTNGNLCSSLGGITSVSITSAKYDGKGNYMNAYLKIDAGGTAKVTITIAEGYAGTLSLKAGGYSANPTISVSNSTKTSGTVGGVATTENNFNELKYILLSGTHEITCSSKNMYISEMDLVTYQVSATISAYGWATFSSEYPLDLANLPDGLTAYQIREEDIDGDVVTPNAVSVAVAAQTGLLLKGAADTYNIPVATSGSTLSSNKLVAVTANSTSIAKEANLWKYVLAVQGGKAVLAPINGTAASLNKGQAYLQLDADPSSPAPSALRFIDDANNTTDIEAIEASEKAVKFFENGNLYIKRDGVVYDVTGRVIR